MLWPSIGLRKSSLIATLEGGVASTISMRPVPTLAFPSHSYTAPTPLAAPLCVLFIVGSSFSQCDHELQLWRSIMRGKIFSGGALIFAVRCTLNESGLVMAKPRTAAIRTTTTILIILMILDIHSSGGMPNRLRFIYSGAGAFRVDRIAA